MSKQTDTAECQQESVVMSLWEIDGEDLIVAKDDRDMRAVYVDYHGHSIRGHDRRLVLPTEVVDLVDGGEETFSVLAKDYVKCGRGYYAAMR